MSHMYNKLTDVCQLMLRDNFSSSLRVKCAMKEFIFSLASISPDV